MADRKPKAKGVPPAKAAPPKRPAVSSPEQFERFIEAAEEAGVTDESLDKAVRKLAPPKKGQRPPG